MPDGAGAVAGETGLTLRGVVLAVALALMLGWVLYLGRGIFVPIVSAVLIIYVIVGVARVTAGLPMVGRLLPLQGHYILAALAIALGLIELVSVFTSNLTAIVARAPQMQAQLMSLIQHYAEQVGVEDTLTWETVQRYALGPLNLQTVLRTGLSSAASLVSGLFLVLLNVAFMMLEQRSFYTKLERLFPDPARCARLLAVVQDINARVGRYLAVKTMINGVLGVVSYAILWVFGVEFAVFWAIVIAVLNYIPYIGSVIAVAFPVALAVVQFDEIETVLLLALALTVAQVLMGNVVEPQVMGTSLNLSPYVILVALTAWSSLWGITGAIVSVPVTAVMVIVFAEFEGTRPLAVLLSRNGDLHKAPATER
jgi:predicted PurR-regulated permease PerM